MRRLAAAIIKPPHSKMGTSVFSCSLSARGRRQGAKFNRACAVKELLRIAVPPAGRWEKSILNGYGEVIFNVYDPYLPAETGLLDDERTSTKYFPLGAVAAKMILEARRSLPFLGHLSGLSQFKGGVV